MSGVPNVFGSATSSIPLSQLDVNFNTPVTIGNTTVGLGNTVTSFGNVTLVNATLTSANVSISGGSANGVVYINSSNVAVASPAVLAFDGTNLGLGVTPSTFTGLGATVFESNGGATAYRGATSGVEQYTNTYFSGGFLYKANGYATRFTTATGAFTWYTAPSGTAGNVVSFITAMTLDASSNLQVGGTVNPTSARVTPSVSGDGSTLGSPMAFFYNNTVGANAVYTWRANASRLTLSYSSQSNYTSYTDIASFDSSGRLLVGLTSTSAYTDGQFSSTAASTRPASTLKTIDTPSQSTQFIWNATDSGTRYFQSFLLGSSPTIVGSITSTGSVTLYNASSDYRLKNNQAPLTGSGTFIDALQPKTWDWAHDGSKGVGFIAHEFAEVSPSSVNGEKDAVDAEGKPLYQSMQASSAEVIANLVAELQSLRKRVAALEA